jgi:hypothetical protein
MQLTNEIACYLTNCIRIGINRVYELSKQISMEATREQYYFWGYNKWLTMYFKTRWRFSVISNRRVKPLRWKMTEKRPRVLKNIFNYFIAMSDSMFIKDLVMWRHYNVILENSDITMCILDSD